MNLQTLSLIDKIRDLSFKDYLTGLFNRRYFFEYTKEKFKKDAEKSVVLLDIDHFKKVNDTYGHDGGDEVLRRVASVMTDFVGDDGLVTRFGGEEFCIYLSSIKDFEYYESLRKRVEDLSIYYNGEEIKITASLGVCVDCSEGVEPMINCADGHLYMAKNSGRNKVITSD